MYTFLTREKNLERIKQVEKIAREAEEEKLLPVEA